MPLQTLAALTVVSMAPFFTLPIDRPASIFTEVPPTLLRLPTALHPPCPAAAPGALALYMSTGYVGLCVAANATALPTAPGAPPLTFDLATCSVPFSGESWRDFPPDAIPDSAAHYRNYDGVMSATVLQDSLLLLRHGEHKNELCWANANLYQGDINANVLARDCYSGFHNGSFADCQPSYNAFVSGAQLRPFSAATCYGLGQVGNASTVDLGPLAWPVAGYLNASGGKASYGVRQPSALRAWDGSAMLLWIDNGFDTADVWVARAAAPAAPGGAPSFMAHSAASGAWDLPTVPPRLAQQGVMGSLQDKSPAGAGGGAPAFSLAPACGAVHAAAARLRVAGAPTPLHLLVYDIVNYTQCFGGGGGGSHGAPAGLGTRLLQDLLRARNQSSSSSSSSSLEGQCIPPWRLMLRITEDFVTFSQPVELSAYAAPGWGAAMLAYPTLLSGDGSSSEEVDAEGFLVLGTCAQAGGVCQSTNGPQVTAARVAVSLTPRGSV